MHSPDLATGSEPDSDAFEILVQAEIGLRDDSGGDTFSFVVASPRALTGRDSRWGRGHLLMDTFSWRAVEDALRKLISSTPGKDWNDIAMKLSRELHWEFENYRDTPDERI